MKPWILLVAFGFRSHFSNSPLDSSVSIRRLDHSLVGSGTVVEIHNHLYCATAEHVAVAISKDDSWLVCEMVNPSNCIKVNNFIYDWSVDESTDWALMKLSSSVKITPAKISNHKQFIGDPITIIGNPMDIPLVSHGAIGWITSDRLTIDGVAMPGSSGGGVFDDRGELIGIVTSIPIYSFILPQLVESIVYAVPVSALP